MPQQCSSAASVSVRAPESEPHYRHVSKVGIGNFPPCPGLPSGLVFLFTNPKHRFLIWIGSDQEKTFGPTISRLIHDNIEPERMILWDSKKRGGRPDTMELLKDTWTRFGAEVIFITSNMKGNDEMMQGCRAGTFIFLLRKKARVVADLCGVAGLHAFGTLWDF
jgi:hypothetical protein